MILCQDCKKVKKNENKMETFKLESEEILVFCQGSSQTEWSRVEVGESKQHMP